MARASEKQFDELHRLVTTELISRIKNNTASTQDIRAACDWLSKNNITGLPISGSPLSELFASLPELDLEEVERVIR